MKKIVIIAVVLLLAVVLTFIGCSKSTTPPPSISSSASPSMSSSTQPPAKTYEIKLQSHMPLDNPTFIRAQMWADDLMAKSNGQFKFTYYPSNQLAPLSESLDALASGAFDVLLTSGNFFSGTNHISDFVWLAGVFPTQTELNDAWWNKGLADIMDKVYQEKSHVKSISLHYLSGMTLHSKKKITTLEDWKGVKVGTGGKTTSDYAEHMGAVPVNIPPNEIYIALQRGTCDATLQSTYTLKSYALAEVVKYILDQPLMNIPAQNVWVNLDTWNSWPANLQQLFIDTRKDWSYQDVQYIKDSLSTDIQYGRDNGVEVVHISDAEKARWNDATSGLVDIYLQLCDEQGIGDEAREILAIGKPYWK